MYFQSVKSISRTVLASAAILLGAGIFSACNSSDSGTDTPPIVADSQQSFAVSAGMRELQASDFDTLSPAIDLQRLNVDRFDRVYTMTTPTDASFRFSVVARAEGNAGRTAVNLAHGAVASLPPTGGIETIALEGIQLDAPGLSALGDWCEVVGDGFVRLNVSGAIQRDQVLVIEVPRAGGAREVIGIDLRVGPPSDINQAPDPVLVDGAPLSDTLVFTSPSPLFGLPAIAESGDRFSIVAYDGDHTSPQVWDRQRVWLQFDPVTLMVLGGSSQSPSPDSGFWRDQEIASLGNVIAIVYTGNAQTRVDISLDRGVTFPIQQVLATNADGRFGQRLVNVSVGDDYTLSLVYWESTQTRANGRVSSVLRFVEATPNSLDTNNTPTGYTFGTAQTIHAPTKDVTPMVMEVERTIAGDTVIGYGYTTFDPVDGEPFSRATATFLCSTRKASETTFSTVIVDSEVGLLPTDPSISLVGSGSDTKVFYAYEKSDGVYLAYSSDCGATFTPTISTGASGAYYPTVRARAQGTDVRVDLLYLDLTTVGFELHNLHWNDFDPTGLGGVLQRVTTAESSMEEVGNDEPIFLFSPSDQQRVVTDVAQFGYDAVLTGDDVAIVVHEQTRSVYAWLGLPQVGIGAGGFGANMPFFGAAEGGSAAGAAALPPVLLPGMGNAVASPNADHMNKLRVIVLD